MNHQGESDLPQQTDLFYGCAFIFFFAVGGLFLAGKAFRQIPSTPTHYSGGHFEGASALPQLLNRSR